MRGGLTGQSIDQGKRPNPRLDQAPGDESDRRAAEDLLRIRTIAVGTGSAASISRCICELEQRQQRPKSCGRCRRSGSSTSQTPTRPTSNDQTGEVPVRNGQR
jgi:hypothetical protein